MKTTRFALAVVLLSSCAAIEARSGEITISPPSHDFGPVSVSAPAAFTQVTILNVGTTSIVNGLSPSPGCNGYGVSGAPFPLVIGNNQSVNFNVTFDPVTRGPSNCAFMTQDPDANLDVIQLNGVGTAPLLGLLAPPFPVALLFDDQNWDGGPRETLYVEIENVGNEAITAGHLLAVVSGPDFAVGLPTLPIAPNGHAMVPVYFDPTSEGAKNDMLHVEIDNDLPGEIGVSVNLIGNGITGKVGVDPLARLVGLRLVGPNPVTDQTRFAFDLATGGRVKLGLYSMSGRLVQPLLDRVEEAGPHTWSWSQVGVGALPSGMYLVRLSFEGRVMGASRVVLVR